MDFGFMSSKKSVVFLTAFYFSDYLKSNQKRPKNGFYQVIMNIWVMRITKILLAGQLLPFKWLKFNLNSFSLFSEILVGPKSYLHLPAAEIVKRTTLNSCYCRWVFTHTLGNSPVEIHVLWENPRLEWYEFLWSCYWFTNINQTISIGSSFCMCMWVS